MAEQQNVFFENQLKNIDAILEANRVALKGYQARVNRQGEIAKESLNAVANAMEEGLFQDIPARVRGVVEYTIENTREVYQMNADANREAFTVIRDRVEEVIADMRQDAEESIEAAGKKVADAVDSAGDDVAEKVEAATTRRKATKPAAKK